MIYIYIHDYNIIFNLSMFKILLLNGIQPIQVLYGFVSVIIQPPSLYLQQ